MQNKNKYFAHSGSNLFWDSTHANKQFTCSKIRPNDAQFIQNKIYSNANKTTQDNKIAVGLI